MNLDLGLMLEFSHHATQRASQRGVTRNIMRIMVNQGEVIRKQGIKYYFMTHNTLRYFDLKTQDKLRNLVVLVKRKERGDIVITCYKDERAIKNIKHKQKRLARYTRWSA